MIDWSRNLKICTLEMQYSTRYSEEVSQSIYDAFTFAKEQEIA